MGTSKTKQRLLLENEDLRARLREAEETLRAIRSGEVDALVVSGPKGDQIFTLQGADRLYRILMETMGEGAATLGRDGTILYCNRQLAAMLGMPLEKVIGSSIEDHVSSEEWQTLKRLFKDGESSINRGEFNLRTGAGSEIPVLFSSAPLEIENEQGMCLTAADLTKQKRAEEDLRQAHDELEIRVRERTAELAGINRELQAEIVERRRIEKALRESEALLRAVLDGSPDPIFLKDCESRLLLANPATFAVIGKPANACLGKTDEQFYDHPADGRVIMANDRRIMASGQTKIVEETVSTPSGPRHYLSTKAPYRDVAGNIIGLIGIAREITEQKQAEEALRKSRDELELRVQERTAELARANRELREEIAKREKAEQQLLQAQKLESIGTLTGGIAHDINNILGPIVINSEMALMDLPKESGLRNQLEMILKSGLRGKDLVRQMLLLSRKSEKKQEVLSLGPLITETFKLLRSSLPTTIQMRLQMETKSDAVYADPSQIQQVIMNLCTNAAYAMRMTTGSIDISLQGTTLSSMDVPEPDMQPGDYLVVSVRVRDREWTKKSGNGSLSLSLAPSRWERERGLGFRWSMEL